MLLEYCKCGNFYLVCINKFLFRKLFFFQLIDGRSTARRNVLRSTSTGSSTETPTPTHTPIPANPLSDPLLSHSSLDGSDPLTHFAREELDPLSKMAADEVTYTLWYSYYFRGFFTHTRNTVIMYIIVGLF